MPDHLNDLVVETLEMFHTNFEFALEHIDAQAIRRMVRDQLTAMGAIAIRRQGSVYFAPIKEKARTLALEQFCAQMGTGSVFHSIPLPDTTKQREMIHQAFQEEVHEEATQLITELRRIHATEAVITAKAWIEYQKKLKQLQANFGVYGDMVGMEMTKAETELEAVNKQLKNLMSEGKVKS
jgi:SHS2 domain-containing protein